MELWNLKIKRGKESFGLLSQYLGENDSLLLQRMQDKQKRVVLLTLKWVNDGWMGVPQAVVHLEIGLQQFSCCSKNNCWRQASTNGPHRVDQTHISHKTHPAMLKEKQLTAYHRAMAQEVTEDSWTLYMSQGYLSPVKEVMFDTSTSKNVKSKKYEMYCLLSH